MGLNEENISGQGGSPGGEKFSQLPSVTSSADLAVAGVQLDGVPETVTIPVKTVVDLEGISLCTNEAILGNSASINLSHILNKYDFGSVESARGMIPTPLRKVGVTLTYQLSSGVWIAEKFMGPNPVNWLLNWRSCGSDLGVIVTKSFLDSIIAEGQYFYTLQTGGKTLKGSLTVSSEKTGGVITIYQYVQEGLFLLQRRGTPSGGGYSWGQWGQVGGEDKLNMVLELEDGTFVPLEFMVS